MFPVEVVPPHESVGQLSNHYFLNKFHRLFGRGGSSRPAQLSDMEVINQEINHRKMQLYEYSGEVEFMSMVEIGMSVKPKRSVFRCAKKES